MCEVIALAVAADDAVNFPELQIVKKLMAGDSYLAYEQLIDVVGVYQFFVFLPFPFAGLSSISPFGML